MTTRHAMWPGNEFNGTLQPDVRNTACMKNCATEPSVASFLPDFARNAHGNLAEQNRAVGAQLGADTSRPEGPKGAAPAATISAAPAAPAVPTAFALAQKNNCTACHAVDKKILGPSFVEIAKKYPGQTAYLAGKIKSGGSGVWGSIPMPAQTLNDADAKAIAAWLATGANR
jgi:cytochrome c